MAVIIEFDSGFDTRVNLPRLEALLMGLGLPRIVSAFPGRSARLEWTPLYPGLPATLGEPAYMLEYPWPNEYPKRTVVGVSVSP